MNNVSSIEQLGNRLNEEQAEIAESNPIKAELSQLINCYMVDVPLWLLECTSYVQLTTEEAEF